MERKTAPKPMFYGVIDHPAVRGFQVFCGMRQSIPSSSIDNCAGLTVTLPSDAAGQTYLPFSKRLENIDRKSVV